MKKNHLLIAAFLVASIGFFNLRAQTTDITSTYLSNADFETNPTGDSLDNTIYDVPGWTEYKAAGTESYYKLATVLYDSVTAGLGTVPANGSSVTTGNTACLGVKLHWYNGDAVYVEQTANLPLGQYLLTWDSYVAQTVSNGASESGVMMDGVGSYDALPSAVDTWKKDSLVFKVTNTNGVTVRMGYSKTANAGGGSSPILFIDNVKLFSTTYSNATLTQLVDSATTMNSNQEPVGTSTVYAELQNEITKGQAVIANSSATAAELIGEENALKTIIAKVHGAILQQSWLDANGSVPFDVTSIITNPSFESGLDGWTVIGGLHTQTNTSFSMKDGSTYIEYWQSSGSLSGKSITQTISNIPNGVYTLTASAMEASGTTGGAFVFANNNSKEVFGTADYSVTTAVTNNQLTIGFKVDSTSNWVATDNYRLTYKGADASSNYLVNSNFNDSCDYLTADAAANLGSANGGANIKTVKGWTIGDIGDNSAAASYEYGYTGTLNGNNIPAAGPDGLTGTGQGALGVSVAWSGKVTYYQHVILPPGKYTIEYAAYNSGPTTADNSVVGWVPDSVGTSVLSTMTSFPQNTWINDKVTFIVTDSTSGKVQVGLQANNAGSGSHGRIFFDYVKMYSLGIDKSDLKALIDSANVMYSSQVQVADTMVYTDLDSAIVHAQTVYNDTLATMAQVLGQEDTLKASIAKVQASILLQSRVNGWTAPQDVTSAIENPSFESGLNGWTVIGGMWTQTNTSFTMKDGNQYVEYWQSSSNGGLKDKGVQQTLYNIPNGIYKLTASAMESPDSVGGAYIFANGDSVEVFGTDDYTVTTTVTNNQLTIGFAVDSSGNWVATDNYRLTYESADQTSKYLANSGFDMNCDYLVGDAATNLGSANGGANIIAVDGWTIGDIGDNSAAASYEYGYTGTLNASGSTGTIPAAGPDGATGTGHGALGVSVAWSGTVTYYQNVKLAPGVYTLEYAAYNSGPTTADNSRVGWVPDSVGTSVLSTRTSFPQNEWIKESITFNVADTTTGKIQVGLNANNSGSGSNGRIFFDYVNLYASGVNKSGLKVLLDSANVMYANQEEVADSMVYVKLDSVITAAQTVYDNTSATMKDVVAQQSALEEAIANVHGSILLQSRITTWTPLPYDATEAIINHSFESGTTGWTITGGMWTQTNTSFSMKDSSTYVEYWQSSGALVDKGVSQTIMNVPNGIYKLTASAMESSGTTGGAYIYANADSIEVFGTADYSVTTKVTNNQLTIGFAVVNSANWVATDNFRLTYLNDNSPYFLTSDDSLAFTPHATQKVINIKGDNLGDDVTLSFNTSMFSASSTTLPKDSVMTATGTNVTISTSATAVAMDTLTITSGTAVKKVLLSFDETAISLNTKAFFCDQSTVDTLALVVSGDLFSDVALTAPSGVTLSKTTITPDEAFAGQAVKATWDGTTRIENGKISVVSGDMQDSVVVFAVNDNVISSWDGDDVIGTGSSLSDFGWTETDATGADVGTLSNLYDSGSGIRYEPMSAAAHTYLDEPELNGRTAYLRTWGSTAPYNTFNLNITGLADTATYVFRGILGWHNNGSAPNVTVSVNTDVSGKGQTLGTQTVYCPVRQAGEDFSFEFKAIGSRANFLEITCDQSGDAMVFPDYMAIYKKYNKVTETPQVANDQFKVRVINGALYVENVNSYVVYNLQGEMVANVQHNSSSTYVNLNQGIYIVRSADKVQKVFVK